MPKLPPSNSDQGKWFPSWPPEVVADFFDHYHSIILWVAIRYGLEAEGADIAQDTVLRLREIQDEYDPAFPLWPWVRKVVFYIICERKKKLKVGDRSAHSLETEPAVDEQGFTQVWQQELLERAKTFILSKGAKGAITWAHVTEEIPTDEIARKFNVSVSNVYTIASRMLTIVKSQDFANQMEDE